jgi:Flp pilus assembly protein TadB
MLSALLYKDLTLVEVGLPPLITGVLGLAVVAALIYRIRQEKRGNELMEEIAEAIQVRGRTLHADGVVSPVLRSVLIACPLLPVYCLLVTALRKIRTHVVAWISTL